MTDDPLDTQPAVFLDTNALQYIHSYIRNARTHRLPPFSDVSMDYCQIRGELRRYLPERFSHYLMNGCKTLAFLQHRVDVDEDHGMLVYTSRLSKAEILHGILDGQAHAKLAREGMPYRMRQRLRDLTALVSMRLDRQDFENLRQEVDELLETLEDKAGIHIYFAEDSDSLYDITGFSELLQSNVFLDVLDCWMYGCAVALQVDQIISFDDYFRRVVNSIHNPQGQTAWQEVKDEFREELDSVYPVRTAVRLTLPDARGIPNDVPPSWE